jgi:hypothetical protein
MKRTVFFLILLGSFAMKAYSRQKKAVTVTGQLTDSLQKQQLQNATVSLMNGKDSALIAFTRTDESGRFTFNNVVPGEYRLNASHVNFHQQWKNFRVTGATNDQALGRVVMRDKSLLADVTVLTARPPVVVNGDTLEFNAEAFKTKPNAVVEDMLKKMPGVEVGKDGSIKVNGKVINRVLVNGKDFFNGDPKMATRNLPADALDKVQVYDKASDQAAFTGMDDGNSEKTINLKLKKDKSNAAFGKTTAAAGTNERFDGQFNLNKFKGNRQLSAIGMANNINKQGFSLMDMLNFSGQNKKMMSGGGGIVIHSTGDEFGLPIEGINNSQGITRTIAGGINYSDTWNKKTEVNMSYVYNNLTVNNTRNSVRQNVGSVNNFISIQDRQSTNKSVGNRINFSIDHRINSFNSLKLTSMAGYQEGAAAAYNTYRSFEAEGLKPINDGFSRTHTATDGYTINNNLLYRHKFAKKGRTFSLTGSTQYNNSNGKSDLNSINDYFIAGAITAIDTINQVTRVRSITDAYGLSASYTEPLSKRTLLEFRSSYNTSTGKLDRKTYDYNNGSGKHDVMNKNGSSAFENEYDYGGVGTSFRMQQKKFNLSAGANLQRGILKSHLTDSAFSVKQSFTNLMPLATFNYNFSKFKNIRLDYTTSTRQPSAQQLQPVRDNSDPLYIRQGNPNLKQEYSHNIGIQYFNAIPAKQQNLFAFLSLYTTKHTIVNSDAISATGVRTSQPVNGDGAYSMMGNVSRGFGVSKWKTRFTYGGNVNYNKSVNFIDNKKNTTGNLSFTPQVSAQYAYKQVLDISLAAKYTINKAKYSLQPRFNNKFSQLRYDLDATLTLPRGFTIYNDVSYSSFAGREDGFNPTITIWNASLSKLVLKNKKGEIKLSVFDLLRQQNGIDRTTNFTYIEDVRYQALQQYYTLGFTYSLQKSSATGGIKTMIRL